MLIHPTVSISIPCRVDIFKAGIMGRSGSWKQHIPSALCTPAINLNSLLLTILAMFRQQTATCWLTKLYSEQTDTGDAGLSHLLVWSRDDLEDQCSYKHCKPFYSFETLRDVWQISECRIQSQMKRSISISSYSCWITSQQWSFNSAQTWKTHHEDQTDVQPPVCQEL